MEFGESVESLSRRFGHPIALSTSRDVGLRALSTQGREGVLDVIEVSYVVLGDEEGLVQPSVWTWLANGMSQQDAVVTHAVAHHINHLAGFRAGTDIPDSAETDRLYEELVASPRASSVVAVDGIPATATTFAFDRWTYGSLVVGAIFVTLAGPRWFVECPVQLRAA